MIACPRAESPTDPRSSSRPPEPVEMRTSLSRAFQVLGPTTPSTPIPAADCRARTALAVPLPKTPSTAIEAPLAVSADWSVFTAAPRSHWRSFGGPTERGGAAAEDPVDGDRGATRVQLRLERLHGSAAIALAELRMPHGGRRCGRRGGAARADGEALAQRRPGIGADDGVHADACAGLQGPDRGGRGRS